MNATTTVFVTVMPYLLPKPRRGDPRARPATTTAWHDGCSDTAPTGTKG